MIDDAAASHDTARSAGDIQASDALDADSSVIRISYEIEAIKVRMIKGSITNRYREIVHSNVISNNVANLLKSKFNLINTPVLSKNW